MIDSPSTHDASTSLRLYRAGPQRLPWICARVAPMLVAAVRATSIPAHIALFRVDRRLLPHTPSTSVAPFRADTLDCRHTRGRRTVAGRVGIAARLRRDSRNKSIETANASSVAFDACVALPLVDACRHAGALSALGTLPVVLTYPAAPALLAEILTSKPVGTHTTGSTSEARRSTLPVLAKRVATTVAALCHNAPVTSAPRERPSRVAAPRESQHSSVQHQVKPPSTVNMSHQRVS